MSCLLGAADYNRHIGCVDYIGSSDHIGCIGSIDYIRSSDHIGCIGMPTLATDYTWLVEGGRQGLGVAETSLEGVLEEQTSRHCLLEKVF